MPAAAESFLADAGLRHCNAFVKPQTVKIEAVSKVSTVRKLGVVARVAGQQVKRSRTARAVSGAVSATGRAFGKAMHQLWLEVTGLVFLAMAGAGGIESAREYAKYSAGRAGVRGVVVAVCFTVTFAWFGVTSFWRVRSKGRR
jgi:hypothetical protein